MFSIVLLLFIFAQVSYGYGSGEHIFLTGEGIDAYLAWVNQDNDGRVGEVVAIHRDEIVLGSWQEDVPSERVLDHFWDPKTGEGWLPLVGKSALERAEELYADALSAYENEVYLGGDEVGAYHYLGRVIHLVEDMAVPAHTLIDWHINLPPLYTPDDYETYMAERIPGQPPPNHIPDPNPQVLTGSLEELMRTVAEISNDYDSDNFDGETGAVNRDPDLVDTEFMTIRNACFPPAMRAAAGVLQLFYQDIQPTAIIVDPSQGEICSGQGNGVEFVIVADSYLTGHHLGEVTVDFSGDIVNDPWTNITTLAGINNGNVYAHDWANILNDDQLWIRVLCQDTGDCESIVYMHWISVDSTSPVISNETY